MREQYEAGDTVQFTFTSSVAPDAAPRISIWGPNDLSTLVSSVTATQSSTTEFYAMITMPMSADGVYQAEWYAAKTVLGEVYPFYKRVLFNVARPRVT